MASELFYLPFPTAFNSNGLAIPGAQLRFRVTNTTTAAAVYSDSGLTTELTNPVVANGAGRFPTIYLDDNVTYRLDILDAQGVVLDSIDPYYPGATNAAFTLGIGEIQVVSTHAALRALTPTANDYCWLSYRGAPPRLFKFDSSNRSTQVTIDPTGIATVAPSSDATGASGAWRLEYDGIIYAEWSDEYSSASDATAACQAAWEYLVISGTDAKGWEVISELTTRGFGDKNIKAEYADEASLPAVGGMSEYDVVYADAEETLWRVEGGAYVQIQNRSLNGKSIFSRSVAKSAGFKLHASLPAWQGFKFSINDGRVENVYFNGNNPSTQWPGYAGLQNNTLTTVLVYIEGYGIEWKNNDVRFSGGDGMHVKGIIGSGELGGGAGRWTYCNGAGLTFLRGSSWAVRKGWVEGNDGPGIRLAHAMLAADTDIATATGYWKQSQITIEDLYSENDNNSHADVQIEGGHYAPKVSRIAVHGTGSNRPQIYLKNTGAEGDSIYQGCQGGVFELSNLNARIEIESEARGNTFIRTGDFWSNTESGSWVFDDAGRDNVCRWAAPDKHAFIPGHRISATSLNGDSTSFVDEEASATGTTAVVDGGAYSPIHDYHPDYTTGPSFVRMSDMEIRLNESTTALAARCTARNNAAANSAQTYYIVLSMKAEAYNCVYLVLYDQANNEYYFWNDDSFADSGTPPAGDDDWGFQKRIRCQGDVLHYCIPFTGSAGSLTRNLRPEIRAHGSGVVDLYHAGITDIPDSALFSVVNGTHMGPVGGTPAVALASLPAATKVPSGTRALITDGAASQVIGATAAASGSTRVPVNSDGTNWKVG